MRREWDRYCILLILCCIFCGALGGGLIAREAPSDSSKLDIFSVEDLLKFRNVLVEEQGKLLERQRQIRESGVKLSNNFVLNMSKGAPNQDKVLIRIAEYYIEEEESAFDQRMAAYEAQYRRYETVQQAFEKGALKTAPTAPEVPVKNYQKAIDIYDLILRNYPKSYLLDDAYYNKGYLLEKINRKTEARMFFQKLIDEFPESPYAPEAYMRLAESYFYPEEGDNLEKTLVKLNKAIQLYKNVLSFKASPRYDEALYKLGWSYYRLAGEHPGYYTDAIMYFWAVVKDIEENWALDPTGKIVRKDLKPEALEFVAASLVDPAYRKDGVAKANAFIERLGRPAYGIRILENMGDRYQKIARRKEAVSAYSDLLRLYPDYSYAPRIYKKIADSYQAEAQYQAAFAARNKLIEDYSPQSNWFTQLEQNDIPERILALEEAQQISRSVLLSNITELYQRADPQKSGNVFADAEYGSLVKLCRRYLRYFPTDSSAYRIHWVLAYVLDTRLGRFEDAFKEYLSVSRNYLEDTYKFDAAINAIHSADTLAKISVDSRNIPRADTATTSKADTAVTFALTGAEKMLVEAYNNFIKLFPDAKETPAVLASAGALYYNHGQFDLARKYYKTMISRFPEVPQQGKGLVALMNSYFFLGQYDDVEIVARKILNKQEAASAHQEIAKSRIGEAIFKRAEKLEKEKAYEQAAKVYERVYEEVSGDVRFADLALFRSARNYEQAGEWPRAIHAYETLSEKFPNSEHLLAALVNIAADYKELEDYLNVARTDERIFKRFPESKEAENALYNAGLYYEKARAWREAIRSNNLYVQTYGDHPEARQILFENARFYLKLNEFSQANQIYKKFAASYPNDPMVVEAFYNRGVYYFERSRYDSARIEFDNAIRYSSAFSGAEIKDKLYFVAEASHKLGEILYREYRNMPLGPSKKRLTAQLNAKKQKMNQVKKAFTKVVELGSLKSFEAMYKIAELYEVFADAIAGQQLPKKLSKDQRLVEKNRAFQSAVPAYNLAVKEYKRVLDNLPLLAEKLKVSLDSSTVDNVLIRDKQPAEDRSRVRMQKETALDSSGAVARKWHERAKERISLIHYEVAERAREFVDTYLQVDNPMKGIKALAFKDQVLSRLVAPQVQTTIAAHLKNIESSTRLGLENKYLDASRRQMVLSGNILADEYTLLFHETADDYEQSLPVLEDLVQGGESKTTAGGMNYYDYHEGYLMPLIVYLKQYVQKVLGQYEQGLQLARKHQINNDARMTTEHKLFHFCHEAVEKLNQLASAAARKSEDHLSQFDSLQQENYQLGSMFFGDQGFELGDLAKAVLEKSHDLSKAYQVDNIWTQLILVKLIERDPAKYAEDLPKETFVMASDTSWLVHTRREADWYTAAYGDQNWKNARELPLSTGNGAALFDSLNIVPRAISSQQSGLNNPGISLDSIEAKAVSGAGQPAERGDTSLTYLRKRFTLTSKPVGGWLAIHGGHSCRLFLNDTYIIGVDSTDSRKGMRVAFETFEAFLLQGENLIAVEQIQPAKLPQEGLRMHLQLSLLPGKIAEAAENIRKRIGNQHTNSPKIQQQMLLNRNRIISQ